MVLIIIGSIVVGVALIYSWVKVMNLIFNPLISRLEKKNARRLKNDNPYVIAHKLKFKNDAMYDEYIQWLDENGGDLPFDKMKTQEELKVEKIIDKKLNP